MSIFKKILGGSGTSSGHPAEFEQLVEKAMNHLAALTSAHEATWQLGEAAWSLDQDVGDLVFDCPSGMRAIAPAQIIGTYNTEDGTWLWGWDHPSVEPHLAAHAERTREYGLEHELSALTTRKLECDEDFCWKLTAVACLVNEAQGAYRGPAGTTMVFMTFGEVALSKGDNPA